MGISRERLLAIHGSPEAVSRYFAELGRRGGKAKTSGDNNPTNFKNNRELASRAGKISQQKRHDKKAF